MASAAAAQNQRKVENIQITAECGLRGPGFGSATESREASASLALDENQTRPAGLTMTLHTAFAPVYAGQHAQKYTDPPINSSLAHSVALGCRG
ncbi:hypothetical protein SRHO_G00309420 [Serrasalmus rhombeus]